MLASTQQIAMTQVFTLVGTIAKRFLERPVENGLGL